MKRTIFTLLGALCGAFFLACSSLAQPATEVAHSVEFVKEAYGGQVTKTRVEHFQSFGAVRLPGEARSSAVGHVHYMGQSHRPAGTSTMWLSFSFRSEGYFASEPLQHFAVIVRSEGTSNYNSGRGFMAGDIGNWGARCERGPTIQPETWSRPTLENGWTNNYLWDHPGYCSRRLQEFAWYHVMVHVSDEWVAIWVQDDVGRVVYEQGVHDARNSDGARIRDLLSGYHIAVLSDNRPATWRLTFSNLRHGWF